MKIYKHEKIKIWFHASVILFSFFFKLKKKNSEQAELINGDEGYIYHQPNLLHTCNPNAKSILQGENQHGEGLEIFNLFCYVYLDKSHWTGLAVAWFLGCPFWNWCLALSPSASCTASHLWKQEKNYFLTAFPTGLKSNGSQWPSLQILRGHSVISKDHSQTHTAVTLSLNKQYHQTTMIRP